MQSETSEILELRREVRRLRDAIVSARWHLAKCYSALEAALLKPEKPPE
jgi:hypothetical protein